MEPLGVDQCLGRQRRGNDPHGEGMPGQQGAVSAKDMEDQRIFGQCQDFVQRDIEPERAPLAGTARRETAGRTRSRSGYMPGCLLM